MELPHEQYQYQQTLAQLGAQIAQARGTLENFQLNTREFLSKQEEETKGRVKAIVDASTEALKEATTNHAVLESWLSEVRSFALELISWKEKLSKQEQDFEASMKQSWASIDENRIKMERLATDLKVQRSMIDSDREQLNRRDASLKQQVIKVQSQQAAAEMAMKEARKLTENV